MQQGMGQHCDGQQYCDEQQDCEGQQHCEGQQLCVLQHGVLQDLLLV